MDEKEPAGLGKRSRWKRMIVTVGLSAAMTLNSCQAAPPEIYHGNHAESRTSGYVEILRSGEGYKEFSMRDIRRDGIDPDYFDLETLAYIYHTFKKAEDSYYIAFTPEERDNMNWKVTGLEDLNRILKTEAPYISKELKPGISEPEIIFPTMKLVYEPNVIGNVNFPTMKLIYTDESIYGKYKLEGNFTEVNMYLVRHTPEAFSTIAHETFHGQLYPRSSIEKLTIWTSRCGLNTTDRQRKYLNEGLAVLFQNEVCANIVLDSNPLMNNYLSSVIASNIRDVACENAIKTGRLPEFESYFNSGIEMGYEDMNVWTKYHRPATLAYLKSIQEDRPIVIDGILIDGLYNFWDAAKKMNDDELEGRLFVKREGLLTPMYDGFTHGYLNGNRFVPLSVPSEVAYEKHWLFENEKKD